MNRAYKKKCERATKDYLKKVSNNFMSAFSMGFADGARGVKQSFPVPEVNETLLYAVSLAAKRFYEYGFETAKKSKI